MLADDTLASYSARWQAQRAEDVVWRRSKLGLRMTRQEIERLDDWMVERTTDGLAGRHETDRAVASR